MGHALSTIATIADIGASASAMGKNVSDSLHKQKTFAPAYGSQGQTGRQPIALSNPYSRPLLGSNLLDVYNTSTGARRGK